MPTKTVPDLDPDRARRLSCWVVFALAALVAGQAVAAEFDVGPAGTYTTVQEGVNAALAAPAGTHEVRVQQGTYADCVIIPGNLASGSLAVTGGWDSSFSVQTPDPALTTIDCMGLGRPLTIASEGTSSLLVQYLTLTGGMTDTFGGGARLTPGGSANVTLDRLDIVGNSAVTTDSLSAGGGVFVDLIGSNLVQMTHCRIAGNIARATGSSANSVVLGAGVAAGVSGASSTFQIDHSIIEDNEAEASGPVYGGAVMFTVSGGELIVLEDTVVRDNAVTAASTIVGAGLQIQMGEAGRFQARRNRFLDNRNEVLLSPVVQVNLEATGDQVGARLDFTDSIVASTLGPGDSGSPQTEGLQLVVTDPDFEAHLTNLSIVDQQVNVNVIDGDVSLFNTIVWGAALSQSGDVETGNNLVGVDPKFVSVPDGDFRLQADSPAINAGTDSPPGGLGPQDVDGGPRILGIRVDQGAHENGPIFADGFESGDTSRWTSTTP